MEDEEEGDEHKNDISGEIDGKENHEDKNKYIPDFTKQEIQTAVDCLKRGTSGDTKGIKAGLIQVSDHETKEMMRTVFNELIKQESVTPEAWKKVVIKMICKKKGYAQRPESERPVCTLVTWYKVFSTLLHNKLYSKLDRHQHPDQGGFVVVSKPRIT